MSISGALFERKRFSFGNLTHVVFWTKGELFYKKEVSAPTEISESTKSGQEKISQFRKNNFEFTTEQKNRLNKLLYRLLDAISRGTKEIRAFLEETLLFKTVLV